MNSGKGSMILLTIIAVVTLLVAVAGTTFAYFSATMNGSESGTTIEVTSGTLSTEFNGDAKLANGYVNPSEVVATKDFQVTGVVTGSSNLIYEATLEVSNNTYLDGELVYTLTSYNESDNGSPIVTTSEPVAIPTGANTISLGTATMAGPVTNGAVHKYTITITYANQKDQSVEKAFDAKLNINQAKK